MARLNIILDAVSRCEVVSKKIKAAVEQPSFVDLGCCLRFFANGMTTKRIQFSSLRWVTRANLFTTTKIQIALQRLTGIGCIS